MTCLRVLLLLLTSILGIFSVYGQREEVPCDLSFRDSVLLSEVHYERMRFPCIADFRKAQFDSVAYFEEARFSSWAYFGYARFASRAHFGVARFDSRAHFGFARFGSTADFWAAQFGSVAYFYAAQFDSVADFYAAQFGSRADFWDAQFHDAVSFERVVLPDTLILRGVKLNSELDLTSTRLDSGKSVCHLIINGGDIEKIKLDYERFQLVWKYDTIPFEQHNAYQRLIKRAEEDGFTRSHEKLSIEYKDFTYNRKAADSQLWVSSVYWRFVNWLDRNWTNYGFNKELIVRNTLFILVLFCIINFFLFNYLNHNLYKLDSIWGKYESYDGKGKGINKLACVFAYTSTLFFGVKFDYKEIKHDNWWAVAYFYLMYVSGLLCLGYLVNFVITK